MIWYICQIRPPIVNAESIVNEMKRKNQPSFMDAKGANDSMKFKV